MGITNANKELSRSSILCGEEVQVRLSLTAAPDITSNPTDIILILDRSGSMAGSPLANLKNGAKAFIDIIDEATDGTQDGQIGSGSRIAVVSFADTATADTQLITSVADLKTAVDNLSAGGNTNHAAAFEKASELLAAPSTNAKVMVMFTDGLPGIGTFNHQEADAAIAKAYITKNTHGAHTYTIGLYKSESVDSTQMVSLYMNAVSSNYPDADSLSDVYTIGSGYTSAKSATLSDGRHYFVRLNNQYYPLRYGIPPEGSGHVWYFLNESNGAYTTVSTNSNAYTNKRLPIMADNTYRPFTRFKMN